LTELPQEKRRRRISEESGMGTVRNRVLVAGATGYLGGFVVREFKNRGYYVRALARSSKKLDPFRDSLDEVVQAEITWPETLEFPG
jgi:uncharacterized protein YbjT (DUF2867 family)